MKFSIRDTFKIFSMKFSTRDTFKISKNSSSYKGPLQRAKLIAPDLIYNCLKSEIKALKITVPNAGVIMSGKGLNTDLHM